MQKRKLANSNYSMKRCTWHLALVLLTGTAFAASPESFDWP
jgi:hypothetical protein